MNKTNCDNETSGVVQTIFHPRAVKKGKLAASSAKSTHEHANSRI
jgi:hypothetical protein